ncbi:MAG: hypothetical protein PWP24_1432, partial [Clostridiales bacterium]|nr:hypothetical protein [Clostridiales bacterium]
HISKAIIGSLDSYLKWQLFKRLPEDIIFINREEDLGITGLRTNKMDMKPIQFHELWKGVSKRS